MGTKTPDSVSDSFLCESVNDYILVPSVIQSKKALIYIRKCSTLSVKLSSVLQHTDSEN